MDIKYDPEGPSSTSCIEYDPSVTELVDILEGLRYNEKTIYVTAIWDRNSEYSFISRSVIEELGLVSSGVKTIKTDAGEIEANEYKVDFVVGVRPIKDVIVYERDAIKDHWVLYATINNKPVKQQLDMIIGKNIISRGDLQVNNVNGHTRLTFSYPPADKGERNSPCLV